MNARSFPDEVRWALGRLEARDIRAWGLTSAKRVPGLSWRRVKSLGKTVKAVTVFALSETGQAIGAACRGKLLNHLGRRTVDAVETVGGAAVTVCEKGWEWTNVLINHPQRFAEDALPVALGFAIGSGGLDGDGGIPDLDIAALGIGGHRSIFFHSVIAGMVVEMLLLSLVDFTRIVCEKLPEEERSPVWDTILDHADNICFKAGIGTSLGIAYHLGVDGLVQPAPYHDFPIPMSMPEHQAVFVANAAAEAHDAARRQRKLSRDEIEAFLERMRKSGNSRRYEVLARLKARRMAGDGAV
jgi:hypothetical protein